MDNNIAIIANPSDKEIQFVRDELKKFNDQIVGDDNHKPINIIIKDENEDILGGLIGGTYSGWLYIDRFWINENIRNQGIGKKILKLAEDEAKQRGCNNVHLDTHDFQAVNFYKQQGYEIKCELKDLPKGHNKYLMTKEL